MMRLRGRMADRDSGEALIFVMLISVLVLIMLGTASTTLITNIKPAGESVSAGEAIAAAEAGIEDFSAQVNANCANADSFACGWLTDGLSSDPAVTDAKTQVGTPVPGADGSGNDEAFVWTVDFTTTGFARVVSTGQALDGNGDPTITRTLVADVNATPSFNNFEYFTKYETFPSDFVNSFYGPRKVQVADTTNSSLGGPGTLQWYGVCDSTDPNDTSHCTPTGATTPQYSTNICGDLYYPSASGPGRGTDTAWDNVNRRPPSAVQTSLGLYDTGGNGSGNTFAYYDENGTFTPADGGSASPETHWDTCDSSFEPNMVMNGPVYSQDAYLVDRGKDTGASGQSEPVFNDYAYTLWNGVINGVQQPQNPNGGFSRAYPNTDGQLYTTLSPQPVYTTNELELPANADKSKSLATCTYTGPTRILIKQGTAYITSPGTPTSPAPPGQDYCYQSTGVFTNPGGTGVVDAQVPIQNTLIYVQNPTSGTPSLATPANPIFDLQATSTLPAATGSNTLQGTWNDNSTYSAAAACPSPPNPSKRRNFDCETSSASPPADMAKLISDAVNATMKAGADTTADMTNKLTDKIDGLMPNALIPPPIFNKTTGAYYQVSVSNVKATNSTPSVTYPSLAPADPFYQEAKSAAVTTTTMTATISINRITCTAVDSSGRCSSTSTSAIYRGSATGTWSKGTPPTTTDTWPWFGAQTGPNTYTDPNNDITRYYNGYGDAYVEGTLKGQMTVVAEHDIVATNNLTYNNTNLNTTTDGLALVADHDVRIYRPMTCVDDGTAGVTSPGYCPNDLTGVYTRALGWPLPSNYPALEYKPDNAPSMTSNAGDTNDGSLYATIFTLRGCFMIDNFYRGEIGNHASVYGGLYQYHRGPTSLPYQGRPYQGSGTKMPGIVLDYTFDNMRAGQTENGGLRVPWIPNPVGRPTTSTRTWNVVSISTGT